MCETPDVSKSVINNNNNINNNNINKNNINKNNIIKYMFYFIYNLSYQSFFYLIRMEDRSFQKRFKNTGENYDIHRL